MMISTGVASGEASATAEAASECMEGRDHLPLQLGNSFGRSPDVEAVLLLKLIRKMIRQDEVEPLCPQAFVPCYILDLKLAAGKQSKVLRQSHTACTLFKSVIQLFCSALRCKI